MYQSMLLLRSRVANSRLLVRHETNPLSFILKDVNNVTLFQAVWKFGWAGKLDFHLVSAVQDRDG